jgi:hypothetical protein
MPYKLEKFPQHAAIFFTTLLQLLDEAEKEASALPQMEKVAA